MRTSSKLKSLMAGVALVGASCGSDALPSTTTPVRVGDTPPAVTLDGTSWMVTGGTRGGPMVPAADRPATFDVDGDQVTGSTGCNTYGATITVTTGGLISLTGFAVTEIGCEPDVMEFETALLAGLGEVDRFTWDGDRLTLVNADGSVTLDLVARADPAPAPLDAGPWRLTGFTRGGVASSVSAGSSPTLVVDLAAGAARGSGGCNDFGALMIVSDDRMTVSDMNLTAVACDEDVMLQEAAYFRILTEAATWRVDGSTLIIATGRGESLTFTSDPGERPEAAALAWITAVAAGDVEGAAALMAPDSLSYADERGGLGVFITELAEGWGAWVEADERRTWSVTGRFADGTGATVTTLVGTVEQEGIAERRAASLILVEERGAFLVHPFVDAGHVGFVVPRSEFIDRVAPDVPFEVALPEGFEVLVFLDDSGPLPIEVESETADGMRVTALAEPLPQPGEHVLTVIHRTGDGAVGARAVVFVTNR